MSAPLPPQKSKIDEYTELSRSIGQLETELTEALAEQTKLKKQVETYYEQLKEEFAKRWPPLRVKQV